MDRICLLSFLFLLLAVPGLPLTEADIIRTSIYHDPVKILHLKDFCFGRTGRVSITADNTEFAIWHSDKPVNSSLISFYLFEYGVISPDTTNPCNITSSYHMPGEIHLIGTLQQLDHASNTLNLTSAVPRASRYGVYFTNCNPGIATMNIHVEVYNLGKDGRRLYVEYLNYPLPNLLLALSGSYLVFLVVWVVVLTNEKRSVYKIHTLLGLFLLVKSLSLLFDAKDRYTVMVTGLPHGWDTFYYVFYCIRCLMFSIVIMLVGMGWSFLRPLWVLEEKILLAIGMLFQFLFSIAYTYMDILGPIISETYWIVPFMAVDLASTAILLLPFKVAMRAIKETAEMDGNVAWNLQKLRLLKEIFSCVLTYEYARRLVKFGIYLNTDDGCGMEVIDVVLSETVALVFYIAMFSMLHPRKQKEFLFLGQETDESTALAIIHGTEFEDV